MDSETAVNTVLVFATSNRQWSNLTLKDNKTVNVRISSESYDLEDVVNHKCRIWGPLRIKERIDRFSAVEQIWHN